MNEKSILSLTRDFLGILVLGFTIFSMIALVTYQPDDPSFNNFKSQKTHAVQNQVGMVGAYFADAFVQAFGTGAFFFPAFTLLAGWILIRGQQFQRWPTVSGAGVLMLANLCGLMAVNFKTDPYFGNIIKPGGIAGTVFADILKLWLNTLGAQLTLITFLVISMVAMTGISVNIIIEAMWQGIKSICIGLTGCFKYLGEAITDLASRDPKPIPIDEALVEPLEPVIVSRAPEPEKIKPPPLDDSPEPTILTLADKKKKNKEPKESFAVRDHLDYSSEDGNYRIPPVSLLDEIPIVDDSQQAREDILARTKVLENKLADFGIEGRVVQVLPGPVITLYEFEPAPGIKVSRILSLTDDLALAMRSASVRILAPVPGKPVVGIEIPNPKREIVSFREIVSSDEFRDKNSKLAMVLGKDNIGNPIALDLAQIPHLLIAGATGSGKSVGINALIGSLLLNAGPDEVKMIMIDPKMLELSIYDGIPHLIAPVVTNPKKAAAALQWAVTEMEKRYQIMAEKGVRNISGYNEMMQQLQKDQEERLKASRHHPNAIQIPTNEVWGEEEADDEIKTHSKLPYIVIIIDELADLMMVASKGVEEALTRLAQMARAAGIHLILATQRPSVDVLTGIIKANFPARISFQVTSRVDSRTILDSIGAEKLLGKGDMLFLPPTLSRLLRVHGAMVKDAEINRILEFIKEQQKPEYDEEIFATPAAEERLVEEEEYDEKYDEAVAVVARVQQASISMVQRKLRIGYNRAARIIEVMEKDGIVGPSDGVKPREVYVKDIPVP